MKLSSITLVCAAITTPVLLGETGDPKTSTQPDRQAIEQGVQQHEKGAQKLAFEQDDLSADVQDLIDEQTDPEVIKLLGEVELIMAEATDLLEQTDTGGATIAVETEVIEKIFDAAKKKQQQSGGG
ncbi:hypothetical protein HW115_10565 [Verrucomicrobiaceae bacterium N1E253]|uniref:Uncharacterized protein n=1 Tax=Oceaniferula marina TaxID=2748318 RepID=A0A851GLL1_9BACT|nr:hypothetical protein [Oceaniferula marina]NWK56055.1 hypothetical protein [Oceaniferula marina]